MLVGWGWFRIAACGVAGIEGIVCDVINTFPENGIFVFLLFPQNKKSAHSITFRPGTEKSVLNT